ncbi:MAG TPA: hypothetical protein VGC87_13435 [Pyrinomonadaceae bacterium]
MKRCPSCNRTYTDDTMTNCAHDGSALMAAAYSPGPQGAPPPAPRGYVAPPPPGYPPPPPQGYQGYQPQNYPPPPGYPPPQYPPPQPGWQPGPGVSEFVPCPACRRPDPQQMTFTWWGGVLGPKLFKHVKCRGCATTYNGRTGQSNTTNIVIYSVVMGVIAFALFFFVINSIR